MKHDRIHRLKCCAGTVNFENDFPKLNSAEIDELQPTVSENRRFDALFKRLNDLDEVMKKLQCDSTTLSDVRALFNAVIDDFLKRLIDCHLLLKLIIFPSLNQLS